MKQEINLEEILNSIVENTNPHGDRVFFKEDILKAMKESCSQCLDLAAENAKVTIFEEVTPKSILQIKDWIK